MSSSWRMAVLSWLKRYHVGGRRWRIQLVDQLAAMLQHRALIDRPLVGDFAAIDRHRRIQKDRPHDPRRRPRRHRQEFGKSFAKRAADQGIGRRCREIIRWQRW